jgi:hypothetical protein
MRENLHSRMRKKGTGMSAMFDTIRRLVERLAPAPICEACIAQRLDMELNEALHASLAALVVERGFESERDHCVLCDQQRPVIRRRIKAA